MNRFFLCMAIALLFGIYLTYSALGDYRDEAEKYRAGSYLPASGSITGLLPAVQSRDKKRNESFQVSGVPFAINPNVMGPGFRKTHLDGSRLENDLAVKVLYDPKKAGNLILRLEICE